MVATNRDRPKALTGQRTPKKSGGKPTFPTLELAQLKQTSRGLAAKPALLDNQPANEHTHSTSAAQGQRDRLL